jgi:hypothetical protein
MDFAKLIDRVKNILLTPKTEWPVIAAESTTVPDLYKNYIVYLAAIPALFGFLGFARFSITTALVVLVVFYALQLGVVYLMGLLVDAFAGTFGAEKNPVQALKSVTYAYTASWVAAIGSIVPILGILIGLAGGIYSIYLLYLGLPHTMKCPEDKAVGYAAVVIIIGWVISWVVTAMLTGMLIASIMVGAAAIH